MTIYYKKFSEARKHCLPGQVTLFSAEMNMYYNGVAL